MEIRELNMSDIESVKRLMIDIFSVMMCGRMTSFIRTSGN